ncbi:MAG TPA: hypothetical protein VGJ86_22620 [Acidimicrobiales bacterium]|jgi:hypothetical protein
MSVKIRRVLGALVLSAGSVAGVMAAAPQAGADPDLPINWTVDAQTHVAGLNQDVTITGGTFIGSVDLGTGEIVADLSLPSATSPVALLGIPLANAEFKVAPTGPVTGTVDLANLTVNVSSSFDIKIPSLKPIILPINLVGNRCQTSTPISLDMSGTVDLVNGTSLSGEFTIPKFKNCGLATFALNLLVPGGGNTFSATAKPAA